MAALFVAGCAATTEVGPPKPTPADLAGIATALQNEGVTVSDVVSGDAGCSDPDMVSSAIGFNASGLDQPTPVAIHLFIFRNDASYQKQRSAVDACAASWVTDPSGYEAIDASPFVLTGQGPWPPEFKAALRAGLVVAAGDGG
jgi:hypothetical protein